MKTFEDYYTEYLGIEQSKLRSGRLNVFASPYRDLPICQYYYSKVIICNWKGYDICSCPPSIIGELINLSIDKVKNKVTKLLSETEWTRYLRYSYDYTVVEQETIAFPLSYDFYNSHMKNPFNQLSDYYQKIIKDEILQIVFLEGRIYSQAYLSDIYAGGGNISVNCFEQYRNRGFASECVKAVLNYAKKRDVLPVYLVREDNVASIRVAEKNGFTFKVDELCAHYKAKV